ncbi:MAG: PspC domain-containing protein [Pseudohongiellaceae bacterium]|nr:PspC domain-containing protein [Pseudohongiellaceae bacterium]
MSKRNNRFTLNRERRRFLGVCAGLADYLEAPIWLIRVITVLAMISWPTLIIVYFVTYWWLKSQEDSDHSNPMYRYVSETRTARHFRNLDYKRPLYRNTRRKRVGGVCSGIADYLEVSAFLVRVMTILALFIIGPFVFFAYCVCWMILEAQPDNYVGYNQQRYRERRQRRRSRKHSKRYGKMYGYYDPRHEDNFEDTEDEDEARNYKQQQEQQAWAQEREQSEQDPLAMSVKECSAAFNELETRLRGLEAFMTSRRFRLHCEINRI